MKLRLIVEGKAIEATLLGNATARDFASLLPLTLTLEDYNSTEKISYLPRKLSTAGAPAGVDPAAGDIAYYAPWGKPRDLLQRLQLLERSDQARAD